MPLIKKSLPKIIVTGATGLVGSRFVELSSKSLLITTIGRSNVDIKLNLLSPREVKEFVQLSDARIVVNFAAYTNVDEAEQEKGDKRGEVFTLNVMLPLWLAESCKASGKRLFHISTDYVFGGKKDTQPCTEEDIPKPVNSWYTMTKYYGEENILNSSGSETNCAIVRISYPYSGVYRRKLDIARVVVERLKNKEPYFGIEDQKIKPTSVDDIAQALFFLLEKRATGIYHVAGNYSPQQYITPYRFAQKIARVTGLDLSLIKPISFVQLSKKRLAPRPQHTWLDTSKIEDLGFVATNIDEALARFKQQLVKD